MKKLPIKISNNVDNLIETSPKIIAAVNATFLSEVIHRVNKSLLSHKFIFWPDGVLSVLLTKSFYKIPGRDLLSNVLKYLAHTNERLCFIGDPLHKNIPYLNKYNWTNHIVSYGNVNEIFNEIGKINEKFIVLNIPSPKQEELAIKIQEQNPDTVIFCTGGALNMLMGIEEVTPEIFYKYGLEWLWRLKNDTARRVKRLLKICIMLPSGLIKFHKNFFYDKL